jgi:hypothetical protein
MSEKNYLNKIKFLPKDKMLLTSSKINIKLLCVFIKYRIIYFQKFCMKCCKL